MAGVENRPYAGTWRLNNRTVVKYTPDALVFLNGDTSLPGCPRCRGRLDIQRFVTSISIEAGTDPTSHSATISLSLPRVQGQQVFVDGQNILRPGLEVHVFFRGYFPVRGMFTHLPDPQAGREISFPNPTDNDKLDLSKYATYPYYPVFHGVVTQVSYDYADGFYTGSLNCASLLHFWAYQNITAAGAWMAQDTKPDNSEGRPTLFGHNFANMHPFAIMYTLYRDVAGDAAGVEFALDQESNLAAAATGKGQQLYDMVSIYWTQRFKTRVQNLRMYGVNGKLFNAAQQAWFGTASNSDMERLLSSPTYNDPESTRTEHDPLSARLAVAKALGLQGEGADFVFSPLIQQDNELVNLSVLDMWAFNFQLSEMGAQALWNSTYQTKLDVARQVMDATGYEFYQDVDGDLVFKPPFWNMDTSPNRYYRLEDQDIINISFVEQEPTATYIIVRGVWIAGVSDAVGNTGPTGKRAMYVDYKLVAKFGWRPAASQDVTYQTDPKVLFWMAVGRLDAINIGTYSARATIPIRAELRPGYPIYIPFADTYYYISQFSHQFAYGGRPTTSLVLTCRRTKWHAPGVQEAAPEGDSAIKLIRLDRPDLAPRPLEVFDNGISRIIGFPNVVMALDPRKMNASFSLVGVGIDHFDSVDGPGDLLFSLLVRDVANLRAFEQVNPAPDADGKQVAQDPTLVTKLALRYGPNLSEVIEFDVKDLEHAFADLAKARAELERVGDRIETTRAADIMKQAAANAFNPARTEAESFGAGTDHRDTLGELDRLAQEQQTALENVNKDLGSNNNIQLLALIFEALQPKGNKPIRRKVDGIPGSDVTLSYFESLTHLKSQYLASSLPGHYRYFSCSHPDPAMQGMPIIEWDDGERPPPRRRESGLTRSSSPGPQNPSPPLSTTTRRNREFRSDKGSLQARLSELGITWVKPSQLLRERNNGSSTNKKLSKEQIRNTPVTDEIATNLTNISEAGQILLTRVQANPLWRSGLRLVPTSAWRVGATVEGTGGLSAHEAGLALDLQIRGPGIPKEVDARTPNADLDPALRDGYQALKDEATAMYQEGLINGLGFYEMRAGGNHMPFVHIDVMVSTKRPSRWTEVEGIPTYKSDRRIRASCRKAKAEGNITDVDACVATQKNLRAEAKRRLDEQLARMPADLRKVHRNKRNSRGHPIGQVPESPFVAQGPPLPTFEGGGEEPVARPTIRTRELNADVDRLVVQFKPTVQKPDGADRAPEAELTTGRCRKGLQLALGPQRTPRVIMTDQIQTISFVRHQASKFSQVVGTSQTSGKASFNGTGIALQIAAKFDEESQPFLDDPSATVNDVFRPPYEQIATDLASVEIPLYFEGLKTNQITISVKDFREAVTPPEVTPPELDAQLAADLGTDSLAQVELPDLRFDELATIPGYKVRGTQKDDGSSYERATKALGTNYAKSIARDIEATFIELQTAALEPSTGKDERVQAVRAAVNEAVAKAIGLDQAVTATQADTTEQKTSKQGKIDKPVHSPVFPVSDEKGYEHYGAYRYGRGLSVEPGGTFEFIHSGQDPFNNVTAQTTEEFYRVFLLTKTDKTSVAGNLLKGVQEGAAKIAEFVLGQREQPLTTSLGQTTAEGTVESEDPLQELGVQELGLTQGEIAEIEASVQGLAETVTRLGKTARGKDTLRELLTANGDDPNLLKQDSFDITDTQFARNFVNFAANYGKSAVFKTTAANAAYRLTDLTSHLVSRAGDACTCRGSYSDVVLAAYTRRNFVAVEGLDGRRDPATAFQSEEILKKAEQHAVQQRRYRGVILEGDAPDAKSNPTGGTKGG